MPSHHHALTPPSHRACAPNPPLHEPTSASLCTESTSASLCTESTYASLCTESASSSLCIPDPLCSALHRASHHHPLIAGHHASAPPLLLRPNPMPSAPNEPLPITGNHTSLCTEPTPSLPCTQCWQSPPCTPHPASNPTRHSQQSVGPAK
ncbi:hypothetical protein SLEP1_g21128 [Rubroshorea leprosula]|uniref:Uncharacterized protein n=1 Tax=Rubroshorea leprosula TaxID=152421 RepID=A0AAV5JAA5_9ROSI|nr:hypothetical protein SLEP1_g21128 [Rubroshorea leprosula]